jgi:hypothetical protein
MSSIKTVGRSGQISLGKEYAGRQVLVDEVRQGVWNIKVGEFIPDSERWLWEGDAPMEIDRAVAWAERHSAGETDMEALAKRLSKDG